jgi:eukaryotic-like serine/threonine-protein kinase
VDGHSRLEYPIGNVLYQTSGWISNIRFSPQYDKIAFMDHPTNWDNLGTLCVVDLSGHVRTLGGKWESEQGLAWRPDGKEIWFTAVEKGNNLNLQAVDLSGKTRMLLDLPVGITLQDIARDGRVMVTSNSKRLAMASSTVGSKDEVELSWHDWNSARDISPDGQYVLFEDSSEAAGPGYSVAMRKVDGTLPVRLGEGSSGGFSPDGQWAVAISVTQKAQVTLLPTGAGQPRSVATSGLDHIHGGWGRFLANGKGITVNANEPGHAARCYLLDLDGGKPWPVTPEGVSCGTASHDSRFMVGIGPNTTVGLYPVEGGAPRSIPGLPPHFQPVQWTKDGGSLYGYRIGESPSKIYKVEIATGKMTMVQELKPRVPAGVVTIAPVVVSRDETRFAYSYNQTLSALYLISGLR